MKFWILIFAVFSLSASTLFACKSGSLPSSKKDQIATKGSKEKVITILFAYTTRAAMELGGPKALKAQTEQGMKRLNEVLLNSNIGYTAAAIPKFAHVKDTSMHHDSNTLIMDFYKSNGKYSSVHQLRQQTKADVICLIFHSDKERTSRGMLNGDVMVVTALGAWENTYIFPHEFGHVLGAEHETGAHIEDFGLFSGYPLRTVSNTGGISIPYFSEDRMITYTKDEITKDIKLGDAQHDNAAIIRKNIEAKSQLGENLKPIALTPDAVEVELVDPMTAPNPPGTLVPFEVLEFRLSKSGAFTLMYNCNKAYERKRLSYEIKFLNQEGLSIPWCGTFSWNFQKGQPQKVFEQRSAACARLLKDGTRAELWVEIERGADKILLATSTIGGTDELLKDLSENPKGLTPLQPTKASLANMQHPSSNHSLLDTWQMHQGEEVIKVPHELKGPKDLRPYNYMAIPAKGDHHWTKALTDYKGQVRLSGLSLIDANDDCKSINFTYLQTEIKVSKKKLKKLKTIAVKFDVLIGGGARVYVFNSKYPNGKHHEGKTLAQGGDVLSDNLIDYILPDENNRIVIVHYDSCTQGNVLESGRVVME